MPKRKITKSNQLLELRFFGAPQVLLRSRVVTVSSKGMALLAYLATEGRNERRKLAWMFWPNASDPLNSLSALRSSLNSALGEVLLGNTTHLELQTNLKIDSCTFVEILENQYEQAWALYKGPFLQGLQLPEWNHGYGDEFEEWMYNQRERFETIHQNHAAGLARQALEQNDFETALKFLLCKTEAPREDMTRLAILCFGALGQSERATHVFAQFKTHLDEVLEVEPTQQTKTAFDFARNADISACQTMLANEFRDTRTAAKAQTILNAFVDRNAELSRLQEHLSPAADVVVTLITGEPGAGKSRLVDELLRTLNTNWSVVRSVAAPTQMPLHAFISPAQHILNQDSNLKESLSVPARVALGRLLPEFADVQGNLSVELERNQLFAALRSILIHPRQPTLLILDDLQWADQSSVGFLQYLHQDPPASGLAMVICQRNTETPIANLGYMFEAFSRKTLHRINLNPLSLAAVAQLINGAARHDLEPEHVHRATGGNAFYTTELIRTSSDQVPIRATEWLRARLERLPELSRQLLEAAAVLGRSTNSAPLYEVAGRSLEETTQALEQLETAQLLTVQSQTYNFNHDLTREAILYTMRDSRRNMLELRAAKANHNTPVQAAQHYENARGIWNPIHTVQASRSFNQAGSYLAWRGDLSTALHWYEQALEAAPSLLLRLEAMLEKATALERYGRHQESLETLETAESLMAVEDDPIIQAKIKIARARLMALVYWKLDEAQTLAGEALQSLEPAKGAVMLAVKASALNVLGVVAFHRMKYQNAREHYHQSLEIQRGLGDKVGIALAQFNLSGVLAEQGQYAQAEVQLRQAMSTYEAFHYPVQYASGLTNIGYLQNQQGKHRAAHSSFETALRFYHDMKDHENAMWATIQLGVTAFYLEQYIESKRQYETAATQPSATNPFFAETIESNLAEVYLVLEDFDAAKAALERLAKHLHEREIGPVYHYDYHRYSAEILLHEQQTHAALIALQMCLPWAKQCGPEAFWRIQIRLAELQHHIEVLHNILIEIEFSQNLEVRALCLLSLAILGVDDGLMRAMTYLKHPLDRRRALLHVQMRPLEITYEPPVPD